MRKLLFVTLTLVMGSAVIFAQDSESLGMRYQLILNEITSYPDKETMTEISFLFEARSRQFDSLSNTFIFGSNKVVQHEKIEQKLVGMGYTIQSLIIEGSPVLGGQKSTNCSSATLVCNNSSFSGNSSGFGTQELHSGNRGCISSNETQTSWFYVNVGTSGTLGMTITPSNGSDDYDFAIWGPFTVATAANNCAPVTQPIRCSWTQYPRTGNWLFGYCGTNTNPTGLAIDAGLPTSTGQCNNTPFVRHLDAIAGEVYILMVDNYSGSSSPFSLSWTGGAVLDCTPIILPIDLKSFTVSNENSSNKVQWRTLSERNNSYFIIERSEDGISWKNIHQRAGAGYSSEALDYEFLDNSYEETVNYYRLTQVDFDGEKETFDVISIDNRQDKKSIIKTINLMGQEVSGDFSGVRIVLYSDGTTEKVFGN